LRTQKSTNVSAVARTVCLSPRKKGFGNDPPRKRTKKNQKGKRPGQTYQRETVAEASLRKHINGGKPPRCGVQDTIRDFEASHSRKSPRASLAEAPVVKHMFA
jgi:hypothetical protein